MARFASATSLGNWPHRNGADRSGMEWTGGAALHWIGRERSGVEWSGTACSGRNGLEWIAMERIGEEWQDFLTKKEAL